MTVTVAYNLYSLYCMHTRVLSSTSEKQTGSSLWNLHCATTGELVFILPGDIMFQPKNKFAELSGVNFGDLINQSGKFLIHLKVADGLIVLGVLGK